MLEAVGATCWWTMVSPMPVGDPRHRLIIFLAGLPIVSMPARYGVDMDLADPRRGFRLHHWSTPTSLIMHPFTFIFFCPGAAIMAYALELAFDIPLQPGAVCCAPSW